MAAIKKNKEPWEHAFYSCKGACKCEEKICNGSSWVCSPFKLRIIPYISHICWFCLTHLKEFDLRPFTEQSTNGVQSENLTIIWWQITFQLWCQLHCIAAPLSGISSFLLIYWINESALILHSFRSHHLLLLLSFILFSTYRVIKTDGRCNPLLIFVFVQIRFLFMRNRSVHDTRQNLSGVHNSTDGGYTTD